MIGLRKPMLFTGRYMKTRLGIARRLFCLNRPFYGHLGKKALIYKPKFIYGTKNIFLGNDSYFLYGARIQVFKKNGKNPKLIIGNGTTFEQFAHVTCGESIEIGDHAMILANVCITDIDHVVNPENGPYGFQEHQTKPVKIGNNVFVGMGSFIFPGTVLGDNVVVGANSVVRGSFPADVMIAGSPAKVIKRFDREKKEWVRV